MKPYIFHDLDGTLIRSDEEVYNGTRKAWNSKIHTTFPNRKDFLSEDQFLEIRKYAQTPKDFFRFIFHYLNSGEIPKKREEALEFPMAEEMNENFYKIRRWRMRNERQEWLREHKLIPGVAEMFKELDNKANSILVTSKDYFASRELLEYFGIKDHFARIVGNELGGREKQFDFMLRNYKIEPNESVAYDDKYANLIIAKEKKIIPVATPSGYGDEEQLKEFTMIKPEGIAPFIVREFM